MPGICRQRLCRDQRGDGGAWRWELHQDAVSFDPEQRPPSGPVPSRSFSALLELEPKSDRIRSALAYAKRNLDQPLTVGQLAEAAHLSPRQFSRVPHRSPPIAGRREPARRSRPADGAESSSDRRRRRQMGFADRYRMRRAFLRAFGQSPQVIRRNARAEVAA